MGVRRQRLPRREPLSRAVGRGVGAGAALLGPPTLVWFFVLGGSLSGMSNLHRPERGVLVTALSVGMFVVMTRDVMRGQGVLPVIRWKRVGDAWELRVANELVGWRTVATLHPGDSVDLMQRSNNPSWSRFAGIRSDTPFPRCAVHVTGPGVETYIHVSLPLHRAYVEWVQAAMRDDGLDVTLTLRSSVRPVWSDNAAAIGQQA